MPTLLPCKPPGNFAKVTTAKVWSDTVHGVITSRTCRKATDEARIKARDALNAAVDDYKCQPGKGPNRCYFIRDKPDYTTACDSHRLWWTLWIVVECRASATVSQDVRCQCGGPAAGADFESSTMVGDC